MQQWVFIYSMHQQVSTHSTLHAFHPDGAVQQWRQHRPSSQAGMTCHFLTFL
jgi:hypothetical protein